MVSWFIFRADVWFLDMVTMNAGKSSAVSRLLVKSG
jgi:hypothetical protein